MLHPPLASTPSRGHASGFSPQISGPSGTRKRGERSQGSRGLDVWCSSYGKAFKFSLSPKSGQPGGAVPSQQLGRGPEDAVEKGPDSPTHQLQTVPRGKGPGYDNPQLQYRVSPPSLQGCPRLQ